MESNKEQRKFKRTSCRVSAWLTIADKERAVEILDIGTGGCKIFSGIAPEAGSWLPLRIEESEGRPIYNKPVKIAWVSIYLSGYLCGISFKETETTMTEESLNVILSQCSSSKQSGLADAYSTIFEEYPHEIFLSRVKEYTDVIIRERPDKADWANQFYFTLKSVINNAMKEMEEKTKE